MKLNMLYGVWQVDRTRAYRQVSPGRCDSEISISIN